MAGNIRFHNKFHAYTHYTDPVPGIPGSAKDPIASQEFPFLGNMYVAGCLSARGWLDEEGECRKFLFEEDDSCRKVKICGDHMEGALHYSHVKYNTTINYDPQRCEIDFLKDTFKTIVCDAQDYHIMPTSLSAGCVTSVRFVNPSANGDVNLAWHPDMSWLNPRPCILSAGEEAILSMTSFSHNLSNVVCVWKEREYEHEEPFVVYSPTMTFNNNNKTYEIDSCAPITYKFILEDEVDVAKLILNDHTILIANDSNELLWDDTSWQVLSDTLSVQGIPDIYELYTAFPNRRNGRIIDDIFRAKELIDNGNRILLGQTVQFSYSGCTFDLKYTSQGSILFNIAVGGSSLVDTVIPPDILSSITVGETPFVYANGVYKHTPSLVEDGHYSGDSAEEISVIKDRIWSKLVREHDPLYVAGTPKFYTIERHVSGNAEFWVLRIPTGEVIYRNQQKNYPGYKLYPLQNAWYGTASQTIGTAVKLFLDDDTLFQFDGFNYIEGEKDYFVDEYIPLSHTGDAYGPCFVDWEGYYVPTTTVYVVPETTSNTDQPEQIHAFVVPGGGVDVDTPGVMINPTTYTSTTMSPSRYAPGSLIRVFTEPGDTPLPDKYTNTNTGPKSTAMNLPGGTYRVVKKGIKNIPNVSATVCLQLECVD